MRAILLSSLIAYSSYSFADSDWSLAFDEDDISIYTRANDRTNLDDFKADITLSAPIEEVGQFMSAVEDQTRWMFDRELTRVLDRPDDRTTIVYSVTDAPWPVSDRDAVVRHRYSDDNTESHIRIDITSIDDYLPPNEEYVRVPYIEGYWELIKIDDFTTKVIFMSSATPGGSIPDWLADSFVLDMPYHSLNNMRYLLQDSE